MALSDSMGRSLQIETRRGGGEHVSFGVRLLVQSAKVLPVMALGKMLGTRSHTKRDFAVAALISASIAAFSLSARVAGPADYTTTTTTAAAAAGGIPAVATAAAAAAGTTTPTGLLLLLVYTLCDAFTWQWQARLYKEFEVDQYTVRRLRDQRRKDQRKRR
jgi:hypothetical protein